MNATTEQSRKSVGQLIDELHVDLENRIDPDGRKFNAACDRLLSELRGDFVATVAGQMAEVNEAEQREETAADLAEKRDRLHIPTTRPAAGEDAEWDKANDGDRFE